MSATPQPRHPALRNVYWREEVLEVVLWLRGEGSDDRIDRALLADFLGIDPGESAALLALLEDQGYLRRLGDGRCALTEAGEEEGRRITGGLRVVPPPAAGPCGPDCWCPTSPAEAARCDPPLPH